ncbi:hypothetical protein [Agromyces mariniharenae]|uniref:Uncharacterized protein n=1 Tax=Agromyces mariniharenae TaxID=2604423 RepID=A0A5S4UV62_9MICO|nr:hypothetical protein [Agromyces mariniharenae]TYL50422.1 hypothetical protein FYC51_14540 [Agromyces mariniharenae]
MARRNREDPNQLAFDIWNLDDLPEPAPAASLPPAAKPVPSALFDLGGRESPLATSARVNLRADEPAATAVDGSHAPERGRPGRAERGGQGRQGSALAYRSSAAERVRRGIDAVRVLKLLEREQRPATNDEAATLQAWPGWGAVPELFNERSRRFTDERAELRELWTNDEWHAAARTTINAHYTDPAITRPIWDTLTGLGLMSGTVLEPGSGSGNFLGRAPERLRMVGIELDPTSAAISRHLHPTAQVRTESFADTKLDPHGPDADGFDAVIGNVPFADTRLHDRSTTRTGSPCTTTSSRSPCR